MRQRLIGSSVKNIGIGDLDQYMDWLVEKNGGGKGVDEAFRYVAWMYRATTLRADALASLPFEIVDESGETYDSSTDYQNKLGFLPNPQLLLWLIEASLTLQGKAYLYNTYNKFVTKDLRYLLAGSIDAKLDEVQGLTGWTRKLQSGHKDLQLKDIVYFWLPDPFVELGPPKHFPAEAALKASGVLLNLDDFVSAFFERGAIKATILQIEGNPPAAEKDRVLAWWKSFVTGIQNAFGQAVFNTGKITPTVVGEGVKELENNVLSTQKREEISTALGVPQTLLFSNAANYATARVDKLSLYDMTIVPDANFVAYCLNEQVLKPMGYRLVFKPETMEIYQEDESQRSTALVSLVSALADPEAFELGATILGYDLTKEEVALLQVLKAKKQAAREAMATLPGSEPGDEEGDEEEEDEPLDDETQKALARERAQFRRYATKRVAEGRADRIAEFRFKCLGEAEQKALRGEYAGDSESNGADIHGASGTDGAVPGSSNSNDSGAGASRVTADTEAAILATLAEVRAAVKAQK